MSFWIDVWATGFLYPWHGSIIMFHMTFGLCQSCFSTVFSAGVCVWSAKVDFPLLGKVLCSQRPASWACGLCSRSRPCAQKPPTLSLILCWCHLEILSRFWTRDSAFSFFTGLHIFCSQSCQKEIYISRNGCAFLPYCIFVFGLFCSRPAFWFPHVWREGFRGFLSFCHH